MKFTTIISAAVLAFGLIASNVSTASASVIHNLPKVTPATEANELAQVEAALGVTGLVTLGRVDESNIGLGVKASDSGIGEEIGFFFDFVAGGGGEKLRVGGGLPVGSGFVLEAVLLVDGSVSSLWYDGMFDDMFILEGGSKYKGISHVSYYGTITAVPLPAGGLLLLAGLGGLAVTRRRKKA